MRERLPLPPPIACWWAGTKLGIAICDIPGKGVLCRTCTVYMYDKTARLMLGRLQASLRGEAHLTDDLAKAARMTSLGRSLS
jgi:hypothetical protein